MSLLMRRRMMMRNETNLNLVEDFSPIINKNAPSWGIIASFKVKFKYGKSYKIFIDGNSGDGKFYLWLNTNKREELIFESNQNGVSEKILKCMYDYDSISIALREITSGENHTIISVYKFEVYEV